MGGFFININVDNLLKMSFIYLATNIKNNKKYVGKTSYDKLHKRISQHIWYSKNKNSNIPFSNALRKYGKNGFNWEIIEECNNEESGLREIYWIKELKPEYNATLGGDGGTYGIPCPEHVKNATRIANSKKVKDKITGKIYNSATEASKDVGQNLKSISRSCLNSSVKTRWDYI
jgi:group I intron endonuclease